jgi:hypothetical protein
VREAAGARGSIRVVAHPEQARRASPGDAAPAVPAPAVAAAPVSPGAAPANPSRAVAAAPVSPGVAPANPSPAVAAVERLPALGGAELVRARGVGPAPPALTVGEQRVEPLADGPLGRETGRWSASFVVPAELVGEKAWLEWPGGPRIALAPARAAAVAASVLDERGVRRAPPPWESHRALLERELARAHEVAAEAREETAARIAAHAADVRLVREEAAARVLRAEQVASAAGARLRSAVAAAAEAESRLQAETLARGALTLELERLRAEVGRLSAETLATRRVRTAESAAAELVAAELAAERAAHAVTRGTLTRLRAELAAAARAPSPSPPAEPAALAAGTPPPPAGARADLRRLALAQAAAAAAARPPAADAGRLVADLDAAAAALRGRTLSPPRRLRDALVALAREDAAAAGALIVQMLPGLGPALHAAGSYDLAITGVGVYAVTLADGSVRVVRLRRPRPRGQADLALTADPLALAEWLAGAEVAIGRWRGRIRRRGSRAALAPLRALPATDVGFTDAARAGARPEPLLVFRALAHAIDPEWTRGHAFTVAQTVGDETFYVTARDGAGLAVGPAAAPPDATVTLTREAFDRLLRAEPPERRELPAVRGDRAAVALLREWTETVRRAG